MERNIQIREPACFGFMPTSPFARAVRCAASILASYTRISLFCAAPDVLAAEHQVVPVNSTTFENSHCPSSKRMSIRCPRTSSRQNLNNFHPRGVPSLKFRAPPGEKLKPRPTKLLSGSLLLQLTGYSAPPDSSSSVRKREETKKGLESSPAPQLFQGSFLLTSASRIRPWLASGWGCRGRRLSRG